MYLTTFSLGLNNQISKNISTLNTLSITRKISSLKGTRYICPSKMIDLLPCTKKKRFNCLYFFIFTTSNNITIFYSFTTILSCSPGRCDILLRVVSSGQQKTICYEKSNTQTVAETSTKVQRVSNARLTPSHKTPQNSRESRYVQTHRE